MCTLVQVLLRTPTSLLLIALSGLNFGFVYYATSEHLLHAGFVMKIRE